MHQYKIEVFNYTTEGSVGTLASTHYADNPEQARLIANQYRSEYQTTVDADSNEVKINMKKYQVRLHILCYKLCEDMDKYFAQYQV